MVPTMEVISQKEKYVDVEANLLARFIYLSQSSQMRLYIEPEITWFTTDIAYPHYVFNIVLRAKFTAPETVQAYLDKLMQDAQGRQASLFWGVGPATQPAHLGRHLLKRGFDHALSVTAMSLDLANLNETRPAVPNFKTVRVKTLTQLEQFITIQAHNSELPTSAAEAWFDLEADIGLGDHLPWQRYLGCWHGKPVAAASTVVGAGVVGLYQVATLPQARGQGLGTAISLAAMQDARQRGHYQAILHSTPMGLNVYRRLGFEPVTNIDVYLWPGSKMAKTLN